jgi:poly-gamma-glutamate synthesis protein (capsule biosynthesis protein)
VFGGDFCPIGRPQTLICTGDAQAEAVLRSFQELLHTSDFSMVNLECPLCEEGVPIQKAGPHKRAHPHTLSLLTQLGVTGVTLANNHIRDYGTEGVSATLRLCASKGLDTVGAGMTLEFARQPLYISRKGQRIAFVNVAEQEFANATSTRAGANPLDLVDVLNDLKVALKQADHVILIVHGGLEMCHVPSPQSVRLLRFFAEQGVTAVIRHHAHVVQGYEVWKGVPIFYGLGNLLFDLDTPMHADWYKGVLVTLTLGTNRHCGFELHPFGRCGDGPSVELDSGDARTEALKRIAEYSAVLADSGTLEQAWLKAIRPLRENYLGLLGIPFVGLRRIILRLGLIRFFRPSSSVVSYWENLLRCETHREVLLDLLKEEHVGR